MATILQDLKYGLRMLAKNPGFTAVAVVTLALGIGANTAIFSLLDAVMLRSLPVREPEQLFVLKWNAHKRPRADHYSSFEPCFNDSKHPGATGCSFSLPLFEQIRRQTKVFAGVTAFAGPARMTLSGKGPASTVSGEFVSGEFFQTLGVSAALGRTFGPSDDKPTAESVAVLHYGYWQRKFGGDRSILGKTIRLNGVPFTIVGVAEPHFERLSPGRIYDLWLPISAAPRLKISWANDIEDELHWWLEVLARIRTGVSPAQARAAVTLLFRDEMLHDSQFRLKSADDPAIELVPAQKGLVGARLEFSKPLHALMLAVGILLMIACANIAGLTLARAAVRQKEIAVRVALGAGRGRIVRQLLTESVLLSAAGGALGVFLAFWGSRSLAASVSTGWLLPVDFGVRPDLRVLAFTAAVSMLTGVLVGLAPAFRGTSVDVTPALKESAGNFSERSHAGSRRFGLGRGLVVAQVALSIPVLASAGLLVRTLRNLKSMDPGFDTRNVLLFDIDPTLSGYSDARIQSLYGDLQNRLSALPRVISASYSSSRLLSGDLSIRGVQVEGRNDKSNAQVNTLFVGPRFFETMRIPLLAGRAFTPADLGSTQSPAVVNRTFVRSYVQGRNPLGLHFGDTHPKAVQWEIVGVVGDAKYNNLRDVIKPTAYLPLEAGKAHFELRTAMNPVVIIPAIRRMVSELGGDLTLTDVTTQSELVDGLLFRERLAARLASLFGLLALVLACVGLCGLLSYEVARRTREIGIRMALGAQKEQVLRLVIRQGIALAAAGATLGVGAAFCCERYVASLLYGVTPVDPLTFTGVMMLLLAVAFLASYIPARRAIKVDPMVALRYE